MGGGRAELDLWERFCVWKKKKPFGKDKLLKNRHMGRVSFGSEWAYGSVVVYQCHYVSVSLCTSVIMYQCRCVPVSLCISVIVYRCHYVSVPLCISVVVYQCYYIVVSLCTSIIM